MRILIRRNDQEEWRVVGSAGYGQEAELQALLAQSPELIPVGDIREGAAPLVAAVREFGLPGSGYTDALAFSAAGDIAVIECKLVANQQIKREVIGQILEYAAYLWGMSYEDLDERVQQRCDQHLAKLVEIAIEDPDWEEESFRESVEATLADGSFMLIIAVDEVNEELRRTIRFLNGCGRPAFSFHALEMRRFQQGETEILVPNLYGAVVERKQKPKSRGQWTEAEFFEVAEADLSPEIVAVIRELYDWTCQAADRVFLGMGKKAGSFTFHYMLEGTTHSVFSVYTTGNLVLNYGWLSAKIEPGIMESFHRDIQALPPLARIPANFARWPSVRIAEAFAGRPAVLEQFKAAVEALGERIRG
ncbi:MAG: hypothetical protein JXA37_06310 [Chloroflexia bacterium]|nr:hypothetical protein [Chloroflexia bacterium]